MECREAWQLIDVRYKCAESPLFKKLLGGESVSGAQLAEAGGNAIQIFYEIKKHINGFAQKETQNIKF